MSSMIPLLLLICILALVALLLVDKNKLLEDQYNRAVSELLAKEHRVTINVDKTCSRILDVFIAGNSEAKLKARIKKMAQDVLRLEGNPFPLATGPLELQVKVTWLSHQYDLTYKYITVSTHSEDLISCLGGIAEYHFRNCYAMSLDVAIFSCNYTILVPVAKRSDSVLEINVWKPEIVAEIIEGDVPPIVAQNKK